MSELDDEVARLKARADAAEKSEQQRRERDAERQAQRKEDAALAERRRAQREQARMGASLDSFGSWLNIRWWFFANVLGVIIACAFIVLVVMTLENSFGSDEDGRPFAHDDVGRKLLLVEAAVLPALWCLFAWQRGWRKRLGFVVEGWDVLVDDMADLDHWRHLRIEVIAKNEDGVDALMSMFAIGTRAAFYRPDDSRDDERKQWQGNEGSANARVINQLRGMLQRLDKLNALGAGIERVKLHAGPKFSVSRWSSDS